MSPERISGIIPPLVTPLTEGFELDQEALYRLVEHVVTSGVDGILLLGSTGENPSLTPELRRRLIHTGISAIAGRVPVMVNITSTSYLEAIGMADLAARAGADFAALAPPYYFEMNQSELLRYYQLVADRSQIPLVLYNVPQFTKTSIEPSTVWSLSAHGNIAGIKESSPRFEKVNELLAGRADRSFPVLAGMESWLMEGLLAGCDGMVPGGANLYPGLYVKLYRSFTEKDPDSMERFQQLVNRIIRDVYRLADSPTGVIIGLKNMLSFKGICGAQMALPVHSQLTPNQKATMEALDREIEASLD